MEFYKPIRIVKTIQVSVQSREDARKRYPHGEVQSVPVNNATHLPGFTVLYKFPQRINVPTEAEQGLVGSGFAKFIPQDKELGADDIKSDISGSIAKTAHHRRRAVKEENKRLDEIEDEKAAEKEEAVEKEGAAKDEKKTIKPSDKKKKIKEDS